MGKRWTIMVIPHDRGARHSFELHGLHVYGILGAIALLCVTSGFLYQRNRVESARSAEYQQRFEQLERSLDGTGTSGLFEAELAAREAEIRAEYEARDLAITTELSQLYDLEAEVRVITGLPPRDKEAKVVLDRVGGKGGFPGDGDDGESFIVDDEMLRPPEIIYGLSRPSADLMVQEIDLRRESLRQMLRVMEEQRERIARKPSTWPSVDPDRWISSRFGYRKDPFTRQLRRHGGVDIGASYGTEIYSTARGTVSFAGYHQYLGNLVKIDHGYGVETWYGHMSKRLVEKGDEVERGAVIGKVGSTGRSTGAHIHYEVHIDNERVDPQKFFGR